MKIIQSAGMHFSPSAIPPLRPGELDALPKLTLIPERVVTPSLLAEIADETGAQRMVAELMDRVRAEDARMRRLLPEPPSGMHWDVELQTAEPDCNFARNTADVMVRLVYRLRES